jgi:hypothetical protein
VIAVALPIGLTALNFKTQTTKYPAGFTDLFGDGSLYFVIFLQLILLVYDAAKKALGFPAGQPAEAASPNTDAAGLVATHANTAPALPEAPIQAANAAPDNLLGLFWGAGLAVLIVGISSLIMFVNSKRTWAEEAAYYKKILQTGCNAGTPAPTFESEKKGIARWSFALSIIVVILVVIVRNGFDLW